MQTFWREEIQCYEKKIGNNKYLCTYVQEIVLVAEKEDDNSECSWKAIDDSITKRTVIIPKKYSCCHL